MSFGTITSTSNTFGSVNGEVNCVIPGTLTGSVGVPGPQGPQGPQGEEGPPGPPGPGSTWGTITGTLSAQTDLQTALDGKYSTSNPSGFITASALTGYATQSWVTAGFYPLTGNPSGFITSSALTPYLLKAGGVITGDIQSNNGSGYRSYDGLYNQTNVSASMIQLLNADIGGNTLSIEWNGITFPSGKQTVHYPGTSILSGYATESWVTAGFAPIAAGQPTGGTVGQVLTKQSGTSWDSSWQTLIPGDRYLTSSTTSLTINNANKTLTIGTGLSYSSQQDIVITYDAANHMHARVLTYNPGTGVMDVDVLSHSGSGTFATWTVNVGGAPALASVVWGDITGTLGDQSDLATALNSKLELSGGTLDANSTITASTSTVNSLFAGDAFGVELTANPSENASLQYDGVHVQNIAGTMLVTASGLTFPDATTQSTAGLSPTTAASTYAPKASPALTGNVTIVSNSTGAALFIEQAGTGNILTLHDQATDTSFVAIDANGKVNTVPAVTASAGFNIPHGTAPTTLADGDVWTTTGGLFTRINGGTRQFATLSDGQSFSGNNTFSGPTLVFGNTTAASTIGIGTGATISGSTRTISIGTGSAAGSTNNINIGGGSGTITTTLNGTVNFTGPITGAINNITLGNGTAASAFNLFTGATVSGSTKAVAIATGGAAGSTTTVTIGNTTGSTTTLQGTTNGVTPAVDTNSTALATTAFVVGQAGSATPIVDGTAAVGTSLRYARQDHVHPTDTSRAALASPTFTGTPLSTTAAADTNTTQIATTAFVVGQASSTTPAATGTAAVGTSLKYARADHVHANPLPTGGTANQVLSKVDGTNYNVAWTTSTSGGADFQSFTTAGTTTWTKPANAKFVHVRMYGGGGGGGSGANYVATTARTGGGGGAGGSFVDFVIPASVLGATETVVVGAGGAGGAAQATAGTNGNNGTNAGASTFYLFRAGGGLFGSGGNTTGTAGGGSTQGLVFGYSASVATGTGGGAGTSTGNSGTAIVSTAFTGPSGGGGGGGAAASSFVNAAGGTGASKNSSASNTSGLIASIAGGSAGQTTGTLPTAGTPGGFQTGGTGGGGGAYRTGVAGMAGAAGAFPGGGGGGGSSADNLTSGAGANGADGAVYIITYS
jgi:hypothetical protein